MAWLSGFGNRLKIVIPSDNIDSTLSNFPILLKLTTSCGLTNFDASIVFDELQSDANRFKIAVTGSDGVSQRYVEIERWDDSSEEAFLWIKVPSISSSGKTELYFYYDATTSGNTTYVGDIGDTPAQNVWTNGFEAVYHMGESSGGFIDSTANGWDSGSPSGSQTRNVDAKVAGGMDWDSAGSAAGTMTFSDNTVTVETWVKHDSVPGSIQRWFTVASEIAVLRHEGSATVKFYNKLTGVIRAVTAASQVDTDWGYFAGTWDGGTQRIFKNGTQVASQGQTGTLDDATSFSYSSGSESFYGLQDETRVSIVPRPASWLKATYYTCEDNLLFIEEDVAYPEWLGTWSQRIKLTIDHTQVAAFDEDLIDFPVLVKISDSSGVNNTDVTAFFDELLVSGTAEYYSDDFTGTNNDDPDSNKWRFASSYSPKNMYIYDNKLRALNGNELRDLINNGGWLVNDFIIEVDFDFVVDSATEGWGAGFVVNRPYESEPPASNYVVADKGVSGSTQRYRMYANGGDRSTENSTVTSGTLRLERVGNTFTMYHKDENTSGAFSQVGGSTWTDNDFGPYTEVRLRTDHWSGNPSTTVDFDNFTIVSGTLFHTAPRKRVAFTTANGTTQCYAEVEYFDSVAEEAYYWVKVPVVRNNENTILYLYYDADQPSNSSYIGDTGESAAAEVWDSNFGAVYHMAQNPLGGPGSTLDSTMVNDGTPNNMESVDLVDGRAGKALNFDGSNESVTASDDSSLNPTSEITVDVLMKKSSNPGTWKYLVHKGTAEASAQTQYQIVISSAGVMQFGSYINSIWETSNSSVVSDDEYHHIAGKYDGSNISIFRDATEEDPDSASGSVLSTAGSLAMGSSVTGNNFTGIIDEVRISSVGRSDSWIKVTNYTLKDDLISFGAPENTELFIFQGTVTVQGTPASRKVFLYRRDTGELVRAVVSGGDGLFEAGSPYWDYHFFVILPELTETYDLIANDKIHPEN
jgi:hypothetical protein